ncbi:MAG: inner membrane protein YpjD, partial [Pseudomonadota bacterium]|nr:inner membrane protein YpjD [Pseudomonadota bacterium]
MTIVLIAVASYLLAVGWLVAALQRDGESGTRGWLVPANLALVLHGLTHYLAWRESGVTDLHFFAA